MPPRCVTAVDARARALGSMQARRSTHRALVGDDLAVVWQAAGRDELDLAPSLVTARKVVATDARNAGSGRRAFRL